MSDFYAVEYTPRNQWYDAPKTKYFRFYDNAEKEDFIIFKQNEERRKLGTVIYYTARVVAIKTED